MTSLQSISTLLSVKPTGLKKHSAPVKINQENCSDVAPYSLNEPEKTIYNH